MGWDGGMTAAVQPLAAPHHIGPADVGAAIVLRCRILPELRPLVIPGAAGEIHILNAETTVLVAVYYHPLAKPGYYSHIPISCRDGVVRPKAVNGTSSEFIASDPGKHSLSVARSGSLGQIVE